MAEESEDFFDFEDGSGCVEIWEKISEKRKEKEKDS